MTRTFLSRPLQLAHSDGLLDANVTVFDYGCGRGDDVRMLNGLGITAAGWDPAHAPDVPRRPATIVNVGYVVNVIEDPLERADVLQQAWELAESVLVVAARLVWDPDSGAGRSFGDGRLTAKGTFQKFYEHEELKGWIEATLGRSAVTAAPGICYVFRDERGAQHLLARHSRSHRPRQGIAELLYEYQQPILLELREYVSRHRRLPSPHDVRAAPELIAAFGSIRSAFAIIRRLTGVGQWHDVDLGTRKRSEQRFEEHLEDLQPLLDFVSDRGRLPHKAELENEEVLEELFGSVRGAFSLVRRVTGGSRWASVRAEARQNFLVYAALAAFGGRPKFGDLPDDLQYDAKDLFGSYKAACAAADDLLFSIADVSALNVACKEAPFGKLTPEALYVHTSAVFQLPPILRVYVGAAERLTGDVDDATIIKLHREKPQVSFLLYPEFDTCPHPQLHGSLVARLPQLRITYKDFAESRNPPILHRKEAFVPEDYPGREKFARLTRQEERADLLSGTNIGRQLEWDELLQERGYEVRGHQLRRRPPLTA